MEKIATLTVGVGGAATLDFTSIPSSYTDLVVMFSFRAATTATSVYMNINGDSSATSRFVYGDGTSTGSSTSVNFVGSTSSSARTANTFGSARLTIANYTSSTNKSYTVHAVSETNGNPGENYFIAGQWANTSAVNRLTFYMVSGNLDAYSTATIYGILKGSGGATAA